MLQVNIYMAMIGYAGLITLSIAAIWAWIEFERRRRKLARLKVSAIQKSIDSTSIHFVHPKGNT